MMALMTKDLLAPLSEDEDSDLSGESQIHEVSNTLKKNEDELLKLTTDVIDHYDNSLMTIVQPRNFEPQVNEFDQLRKRVTYLTKKKRPVFPNDTNGNEVVPWNMQIYQGF